MWKKNLGFRRFNVFPLQPVSSHHMWSNCLETAHIFRCSFLKNISITYLNSEKGWMCMHDLTFPAQHSNNIFTLTILVWFLVCGCSRIGNNSFPLSSFTFEFMLLYYYYVVAVVVVIILLIIIIMMIMKKSYAKLSWSAGLGPKCRTQRLIYEHNWGKMSDRWTEYREGM